MPRIASTVARTLACAALAACVAPPSPSTAASLTLTSCELPGVAGSARCGTYEVPEDRAKPDGRKVSLHVVVLPATGTDRAPDPVISFAGGPGQSAVDEAPAFAQVHAKLRERRDVVLVDLRGTGKSAPLFCKGMMGEHG